MDYFKAKCCHGTIKIDQKSPTEKRLFGFRQNVLEITFGSEIILIPLDLIFNLSSESAATSVTRNLFDFYFSFMQPGKKRSILLP